MLRSMRLPQDGPPVLLFRIQCSRQAGLFPGHQHECYTVRAIDSCQWILVRARSSVFVPTYRHVAHALFRVLALAYRRLILRRRTSSSARDAHDALDFESVLGTRSAE